MTNHEQFIEAQVRQFELLDLHYEEEHAAAQDPTTCVTSMSHKAATDFLRTALEEAIELAKKNPDISVRDVYQYEAGYNHALAAERQRLTRLIAKQTEIRTDKADGEFERGFDFGYDVKTAEVLRLLEAPNRNQEPKE